MVLPAADNDINKKHEFLIEIFDHGCGNRWLGQFKKIKPTEHKETDFFSPAFDDRTCLIHGIIKIST